MAEPVSTAAAIAAATTLATKIKIVIIWFVAVGGTILAALLAPINKPEETSENHENLE